jgi:hypothetical protein
MKKPKSLDETLKHHSTRTTQLPKNPLVRTGGIKSTPSTVAPSKRIGNARGGSA